MVRFSEQRGLELLWRKTNGAMGPKSTVRLDAHGPLWKTQRESRFAPQAHSTSMKTPKTKLQTPEKFQITNSKAATSRAELGFGAWYFFGVWSLVFGVWIHNAELFPPRKRICRISWKSVVAKP